MSDKNTNIKSLPILGISIGDLNGIGPEVVLKSLNDPRILKTFTPVIYASGGVISFYRKLLELEQFNYHQAKSIADIQHRKINVINVWEEKLNIVPGTPDKELGVYTLKSLSASVNDLKSGAIQGLVTAPLSKELIHTEQQKFSGHTEYLAEAFGVTDNLMFMITEKIRIGVVTGHVPLREITKKLTKDTLKSKISLMLNSLKQDFMIKKPRIALLGLNPHAGENGLLGSEEQDIISPVIKNFKDSGSLVFGPYPADGFFGSGQFTQFDGILAMYHDQGLIPFKYMAGGDGVNFTAGIPAVRTSPAHGTAFNIAGRNQADPSSMMTSYFLALDIIRNKSELSERKSE